jgi:LmbE family N-acetylglucosaminyl deacetylase
MPDVLSLMCVHAHPDDECSSTGGILAKYSAEGVLTSLITATKGECGLIRDPNIRLQPWETLGMVRQRELTSATNLLKVNFVNFLGYRDSGMAGTDDNYNPDAFCNADPEEATRRLVLNIRKLRPLVLVTYNENGGYGHPDHVMCNRVTQAAFELAADPDFAWDDGEAPWQPQKLYYISFDPEARRRLDERLKEAGLEPMFPNREASADRPGNGQTPRVAQTPITTRVDVSAYAALKRKALLQHRTQIHGTRWDTAPAEIWVAGYAEECFTRVRSLVPAPDQETDLFAGLREQAVAADDYSLRYAQPVGTHFVA